MHKLYMLLHKWKFFKLFRRPDHISQTAYSAHLTHEAKLFDMDKLWKSDLSQTIRSELSEFLQDKKNGTSNMSIISSFTRALCYTEQSNITQQTETIYIKWRTWISNIEWLYSYLQLADVRCGENFYKSNMLPYKVICYQLYRYNIFKHVCCVTILYIY